MNGYIRVQDLEVLVSPGQKHGVLGTPGSEVRKGLHSNISVHKIKSHHLPKAYDVQRAFSRQIVKERRQYSLIQAMEMIQEPACTAHDALHDAINTVRVLRSGSAFPAE